MMRGFRIRKPDKISGLYGHQESQGRLDRKCFWNSVIVLIKMDKENTWTNLCHGKNSFTTFHHIRKIHEYSCYAMSTTSNINLVSKIIVVCVIFLSRLISQHLHVFPIIWRSRNNIYHHSNEEHKPQHKIAKFMHMVSYNSTSVRCHLLKSQHVNHKEMG